MATSLIQGASSAYINAQNALRCRGTLPEVYVYVEGLDDVAFWKECLRPFASRFSFKVTQLRRADNKIAEGKRHLIDAISIDTLGPNKYVAVDADYDWIIDQYKPSAFSESISTLIRNNPYILHTFIYSIENYKCHPLCIAGMIDKIAGTSDEIAILNLFHSFSVSLAKLFLIHLVSMEKGDCKYTLKHFRIDTDVLSVDLDSMQLDNKSLEYIRRRESDLNDYCDKNKSIIDAYRQKLMVYGFDESKYFLLMQGHIVENVLVKKLMPKKILMLRRMVVDDIRNCSSEEQISSRLRRFEKITCIPIKHKDSNSDLSVKALLKDINYRLDQLISDCTDISKATEGYRLLSEDLRNTFSRNKL